MKMLVLFVLGTMLLCTNSVSQSQQMATIVFVCEHGGARSAIASVYFNKMAKEQNLQYRSIFRGITPDSTISQATRRGLDADGFETAALSPVALTSNDIGPSTLLISLDCKPPTSYHTTKEWSGIPAISTDYAVARDEIVKHLNQLIGELKTK